MTIQDFHVALQDVADDRIEALRALRELPHAELGSDATTAPIPWAEWPTD
jgi:hypothetical protein